MLLDYPMFVTVKVELVIELRSDLVTLFEVLKPKAKTCSFFGCNRSSIEVSEAFDNTTSILLADRARSRVAMPAFTRRTYSAY